MERKMAEISIGNSKESVAYALLLGIAQHEGKTDTVAGYPVVKADRRWILETYHECLAVVGGYEPPDEA